MDNLPASPSRVPASPRPRVPASPPPRLPASPPPRSPPPAALPPPPRLPYPSIITKYRDIYSFRPTCSAGDIRELWRYRLGAVSGSTRGARAAFASPGLSSLPGNRREKDGENGRRKRTRKRTGKNEIGQAHRLRVPGRFRLRPAKCYASGESSPLVSSGSLASSDRGVLAMVLVAVAVPVGFHGDRLGERAVRVGPDLSERASRSRDPVLVTEPAAGSSSAGCLASSTARDSADTARWTSMNSPLGAAG